MLSRPIGRVRDATILRNRTNAVVTAVVGAAIAWVAWRFGRWAIANAIWTLPEEAGSAVCRAARGQGACWAVVHERFRVILFGSYPFGEHWRPAVACALFVTLYAVTAVRAWWKPALIAPWILVPAAALVLLRGGIAGLSSVPTGAWGGLPVTFVLSTFGFAGAFPLAVFLALGRRSRMPAIRALSTAYIEIVRGLPFVTCLFIATLMFPLIVPQGLVFDQLLRAQVAFVLVIAAYVAEVVRAGLAAVPPGQYEAAASLGLNVWRTTLLIVLPQALRVSIPALVNTFIAFFKDTSLVAVIGLFDLLGAAKAVIVDPKWVGFGVEVYLFVSAIYFAFCYAVSRYSQYLERAMTVRSRR